jgi:glc operon protein GlcG
VTRGRGAPGRPRDKPVSPDDGANAKGPRMRTKRALSLSDARRIVDAARAEAEQRRWNVSIAVVDDGGFLLALERMDGAGPQTPEIATRKAWTAAMVRLPTKTVEDMAKDRPGLLGMPGQLRVQGGLPIQVEGEWVGAVGVSGVASHEDEQVSRAGITALG